MKPVLAKWPPQKRTLLFAPMALGAFLLAFLVLGFATDRFLLALLVAMPVGVAAAVVLLGRPEVRRKDGSPLVPPAVRPYLFFPAAPLIALAFYPFVGAILTPLVPNAYLAYVVLGLCALTGIAVALLLFGFPNFLRGIREAYAKVPRDRRPFLFFPLFVVFFLVLYVGLGVTTTAAMAGYREDTALLLNVQVLVLLPLATVLAALGAYLLVGFPKPAKDPKDLLPKVTGRRRPHAFLLTFLLAGVPLTVAVGALLTYVARLPETIVLPLATVLGVLLSIGLAALVWGTPARWRQFDDYRPGLPPRARLPLIVVSGLVVAAVVTVGFGVAGLDIFWGLLTGGFLGLVVALQLAGILGRIAARRRAETLVPDLPDGLKPLLLFPSWLLLSALLFMVLTYALPEYVAYNAIGSLLVGLLIAFLLFEAGLLKDLRADRRREKEKRKAFQARRKEALQRREDDAAPAER